MDQARRRAAGKRGAGAAHVTLGDTVAGRGAGDADTDELLALDDALERLAARQPRLAQVVECRFFGGLTERETAEVLGVTERTVQRD